MNANLKQCKKKGDENLRDKRSSMRRTNQIYHGDTRHGGQAGDTELARRKIWKKGKGKSKSKNHGVRTVNTEPLGRESATADRSTRMNANLKQCKKKAMKICATKGRNSTPELVSKMAESEIQSTEGSGPKGRNGGGGHNFRGF